MINTTEQPLVLDNGPLTSRCHKSSCCPEMCCACNCLWHLPRKAVSGKKVRLEKDGFSLDLTYLGDAKRIIVHGFPSIGIEHLYRNPRYELKRFLEERHKDHYKLFNFCCEPGRGYEPEVFEGRVERYPFKDHNTPPLDTIVNFGESAKSWLDADPANICSMHCKAGKGRAGLMSCILLIRSGTCQTALEALDYYDATRVTNKRGLTVTSQRKFVIFYEQIWRQYYGISGNIGDVPGNAPGAKQAPKQPKMNLTGIEVKDCKLTLRQARVKVYKGTNMSPELIYDSGAGDGDNVMFPCDGTKIEGNFKIHLEHKPSMFGGPQKVFELWHNTLFIDRGALVVDFMGDQLDIKRKKKASYGEKVCLRLTFSNEASGEDVNGSAGGKKNAEYFNISQDDAKA